MGRRVAAPRIDTRPLVLRVGIMLLGIVVLVIGTLLALLLLVRLFVDGGDLFPPDRPSWDVSPGGALVGMATTSSIVAFVGWVIFLNGRRGPNAGVPQGRRRPRRWDGSGEDNGGYSGDHGDGGGDGSGGGD